jgi:hypothetical protein
MNSTSTIRSLWIKRFLLAIFVFTNMYVFHYAVERKLAYIQLNKSKIIFPIWDPWASLAAFVVFILCLVCFFINRKKDIFEAICFLILGLMYLLYVGFRLYFSFIQQ